MDNSSSIVHRDGEAGFTLLELLVGLSITALLLVMATGGLNIMTQASEKGLKTLSSQEAVMRGFGVLRRDLETVQRVIWKDSKKRLRFAFSGRSGLLQFVSIAPEYPTRPGPVFLQYKAIREGKAWRLERTRARYSDQVKTFAQVKFSAGVDLLNRRRAIGFSYGEKKGSGVRWHDVWPHQDRFPEFVRLTAPQGQATFGLPGVMIARLKISAEGFCVKKEGLGCTVETDGTLPTSGKIEPQEEDTGE